MFRYFLLFYHWNNTNSSPGLLGCRPFFWQQDIFTMTTFDYNYQNSFRFCFVIEICQSRWGLKNSPNLHKKTTNRRILVVVVKWRHRAIVLLPCTILTSNFCTILILHIANVFQSASYEEQAVGLKQSKTEKNCEWIIITIIPKMILDLRTEQFKSDTPYRGIYMRKHP